MHGLRQLIHEIHRRSLWQVVGIYLAGSWVALQVVGEMVVSLGLPDWVRPSAVALLVVGFPIVVATALVQEGAPGLTPEGPQGPGGPSGPEDETREAGRRVRPADRERRESSQPPSGPRTAPPSGKGAAEGAAGDGKLPGRLLTWRNALLGGVAAFALLGGVTAGYMSSRALGIGPAAPLIARGMVERGEPVVLAEFESETGDSLLARAATEAVRADLGGSSVVSLVSSSTIGEALERMGREPATRLDLPLAREVARREGIGVVVGGSINRAGTGYVLSARLLSQDGELLASERATAGDSTRVLEALDRLSRGLRATIGESLRSLRAEPPLPRVTTPSLDALEKYARGAEVLDREGDYARAISLLGEAVALDTGFAMAWRKLGIAYGNQGARRKEMADALSRAYRSRHRLPDRERYLTTADYHAQVTGDHEAAATAYRTHLDLFPTDSRALNNLGLIYYDEFRDYEKAAELFERALEHASAGSVHLYNLARARAGQGDYAGAADALDRLAERLPEYPFTPLFRAWLEAARGEYDEARRILREFLDANRGSTSLELSAHQTLAVVDRVEGKISASARHRRRAMELAEARDDRLRFLFNAVELGQLYSLTAGRTEDGLDVVEEALRRQPLLEIPPLDRPYRALANFYSRAGHAERARELIREEERVIPEEKRGVTVLKRRLRHALLAMAEGRYRDAAEDFHKEIELNRWPGPGLAGAGHAYRAMGRADSAIAYLERFLETPSWHRPYTDSYELAESLLALAELHEERADTADAVEY